MLNLVFGRAGTGKTAYVMDEIKRRVGAGETGLLLIVPEQYSHGAERQLCEICGDALSMHGETLSFTRLCGRVFLEVCGPAKLLDGGGQMLVMHQALEAVTPGLKVYGLKSSRAELLEKMLDAVIEFKGLGISPESLAGMAEKASHPLADKLCDLALIYGSYNAFMHVRGSDSADRMALLAEMIGESSIGDGGHIYFDGFNDFTAQELRVIGELLEKGSDITVSLTCDQEDDSEAFELPRRTAQKLRSLAGGYGAGTQVVFAQPSLCAPTSSHTSHIAPPRAPELEFLEKNLFSVGAAQYPGLCGAISIYSAPTRYAECECAAWKALELVRAGHRWRDIAVMARNWDEYGTVCENVFEKYGIPFFSGGKADILSKPPIALVETALEIASGSWEYGPVFRYVKTGLTGASPDECAELENYAIKWNIRGAMWAREWILPPPGCGGGEAIEPALAQLNNLRRSITTPLFRLRDGISGVTGAETKLRALYAFLVEIDLPGRLREKAESLEKRGERRLADEYSQLWGAIKGAMEQAFTILGDSKLSAAEFRKVLSLVLSRYDVGVIPVSLDRAALGGMEMSRRRDLKCLIVLGATDGNMPMLAKGGGALSDSDREELRKLGADMPAGLDDRMYREMNMLYSTLTLPSRELVVAYPACGDSRPSFVVKRLMAMFGLSVRQFRKMPGRFYAPNVTTSDATSVAPDVMPSVAPSLAPSLAPGVTPNVTPNAALPARAPSRPSMLRSATAERLYGRGLSLSPTRVDRYYACPFQHFLQNGLKLEPRTPAEFDAPTAGVFMHYVLEGVTQEVAGDVGFKNTDEALCRALTKRYIEQYVREILFGFEGKNARFVYLFRRLEDDVSRVALDMLDELRVSDFEPHDFELDLSELGGEGETLDGLNLKGKIDRVDVWKKDGKVYLRVVDYKTGRKSFDLSDIVHGRDMQMLIYIFALQKTGRARYGGEIAPSAVLYAPARDVLLKATRNATAEELKKAREKELQRGGLVLNDPSVIEAMENGGEKRFLPIKLTKDGAVSGDSLVTPKQIGLLSKHVTNKLSAAASEILGGNIERRPYYKGDNDNACQYCIYHSVCAFDAEAGDNRRFLRKMKPTEIWEMLETEH